MPRSEALLRLLAETGYADAQRVPLAGDASTRRYERLILPGRRAMLMDAPPSDESPPCPPGATAEQRLALGWNATARLAASRVEAFVAVAGYLESLGLSAPAVYGADLDAGYAVLEDFGDALFPQALAHGADEAELYETAGRILAHLHAATPPCELAGHGATWPLQDYDALALKANADLFVEWLPRASEVRIDDASRARWESVRDDLVGQALAFDRAFTIRDYHAENLIWLPERTGLRRVGLLDFQDAVRGWRAWDLSMLLHDARRDVSPLAVEAALQGYIAAAGAGRVALERELAVLGAINSMRILGIFSRLAGRDGKTRYLAFMPRMWGHLARTLNHPALQEARTFVHSVARPYLEQAR